jgi:hypothetical protein
MRPIASLAVLMMLATPLRAGASDEWASILVRVYNYADVATGQLATAKLTAKGIFARTAIAITWIDCRVGDSAGRACTEPVIEGREFVLRLVQGPDAQPEGSDRVPLGVSMVDRHVQGGMLMTIAIGPLRRVAQEAAADSGVILGRAIAHELGHLLLGSTTHARTGLMRASWSQAEIRRARPTDWTFSRAEIDRMRRGLHDVQSPDHQSPNPIAQSPIPQSPNVLFPLPSSLFPLPFHILPAMRKARLLSAGLVPAFLLMCAAPVWAQTNRISGTVRDETGDPIRGVIVRAGATGGAAAPVTMTAATDDRGRFVFVVSRSGEWRLAFEAPGFKPANVTLAIRLTGPASSLEVKLDRDEAPEAFGALAGVDGKSLSAQLAAAAAHLDEGRYDQAIAAYRDIKARVPTLTSVHLQIGHAYLAKKSPAEAEAAFRELLKADEANANGLFGMGVLIESQGDERAAREWYEKAAAADVLWTRPLLKLGQLARASGDRSAALRYLTRVIELDPASADGKKAAEMRGELQ